MECALLPAVQAAAAVSAEQQGEEDYQTRIWWVFSQHFTEIQVSKKHKIKL